jgi:hypothetical protein
MEVKVHFDSPQPGAHFFFDDRPLEGNPIDAWWKGDDRLHKVRVEAPGYVTQRVEVRLVRDLDVSVSLEPIEVSTPARARAPAAATDAGVRKPSAFPLDQSIPWEKP